MKQLLLAVLFTAINAFADCPPAAPPVSTPVNCNGAVAGSFTGRSAQTTVTIVHGGYAAYRLPVYPAAGHGYFFTSTQSANNATGQGLATEYAISKCPGDFVAPACFHYGIADTGGTVLYAQTGIGRYCALEPNTQYYLNVRNYTPQGASACTSATCSLIVTFTGT